ncbi:MAG: hypothetical protein AAFU53_12360 [Cyanobacteria bacterium J06632_3]
MDSPPGTRFTDSEATSVTRIDLLTCIDSLNDGLRDDRGAAA